MSNSQTCPNCGSPTGPDDRFCPACGQPVPTARPTLPAQYCPQCGTEQEPGDQFCRSCGAARGQPPVSQQQPTPAPEPAAQPPTAQPASKGCFTGWRKAAIIALIALVIICPPTGVVLYFYGASLDDDDSPVNLDDIATIDFTGLLQDGPTMVRVEIEPHEDVPVSYLEIEADYQLGDDSWSFVHVEPSDGSRALDISMDAHGRPISARLSNDTQLSMEYFEHDVVVHYLLPDGTFGAYIIPIEGELRENLEAGIGAEARNSRELSGHVEEQGSDDIRTDTFAAMAAGIPRQLAMLDTSDLDPFKRAYFNGEVAVSVEAYVEDDGIRVPIDNIFVKYRCLDQGCSSAGGFWDRSEQTVVNYMRQRTVGRGIAISNEWLTFANPRSQTGRIFYQASVSTELAEQEFPVSRETERAMNRHCEDEYNRASGASNNTAIGVSTLATLVSLIATRNPLIATGAGILGYIAGSLLPWINAGPVNCARLVPQIIAAYQNLSQLSTVTTAGRLEVCMDSLHYQFDEPCQIIGPFHPFELIGNWQPLDGQDYVPVLGPAQPFNLTFTGRHIDLPCSSHSLPTVLRSQKGSYIPGSQIGSARVSAGQWTVDPDDVVLKYAPEGYYEQCIFPQDVAEATPTAAPETTPTPKPRELTWVLVDTQVNPQNADFEIPYSEPRWVGSYDRWSVSETSVSAQHYRVDGGTVVVDVTTDFGFDAPPATLIPGEIIELNAAGSMSASRMCISALEQFQYEINDIQIPESYFKLTMGNCTCNAETEQCGIETTSGATTSVIEAPAANPGAEFTIGAGLWNCSACNILWTYRAE